MGMNTDQNKRRIQGGRVMWVSRMALVGLAVVLCGVAGFVGARAAGGPDGYALMGRQVAVLLCSHSWDVDGSVRHESAARYVACVESFDRTGIVP